MSTSDTFWVEHRRLHRRQELTFCHKVLASLVVMTVLSSTGTVVKGMASSSRARNYRFLQRTTLVRRQNALSSEASYCTTAPPQQERTRTPWKTLFDLQLPEGRCIGLQINDALNPLEPDALSPKSISSQEHWIHAFLHPAEVAYGMSQPSDVARNTFYVGRLAMRQLLNVQDSILKDGHGRPMLPMGYLGSISHKKNTGVALISKTVDTHSGIGVDIEQSLSRRKSIAKRVLTEREINELGRIEGVTRDEEVLIRFSLKESLYKAMHPLICQHVGFQEAEVTPHQDGTATVRWNLKSGIHENFRNVTAHWRRIDEFILSSASVTLNDDTEECTMNS